MFKRLPNFSVLFFGLLASQAIASVQVYLSNRVAHDRIVAITQFGYLNMPDGNLLEMLKSWQSAIGGGLFFTLSIGAGVTLITLACLWLWKTCCAGNRAVLYLLIVVWLAILGAFNRNGLVLIPSLYFFFVPGVVYCVYGLTNRSRPNTGKYLPAVYHLACITVLALVWSTQAQSGMFITIRDNLLLGNPVGISINDFYYQYTHYSAEAISPLRHKMFKSYSLSNAAESEMAHLENILSDYSYLRVAADGREDIQIRQVGHQLVFLERGDKTLFETPAAYFFKNPAEILSKVSQKTDRNFFFRRIIFFSLMIAFPITLYWMLHALFNLGISFLCSSERSSLISTVLCLMVGCALILPVHWGNDKKIDLDRLPAMLVGENSRDHVAGLKAITQNNLEITSVGAYRHLMGSPHIAVRYWLARALGKSRAQETYQDLLGLLKASQPNVVCQALYSIGQRGDSGAIENITEIMEGYDHWYVQRYAYQALRNLGWKHRRST